MNFDDNFAVRCTEEEAKQLSEFITAAISLDLRSLYYEALQSSNDNEFMFRELSALSTIYSLGFVSGCRAMRTNRGKS